MRPDALGESGGRVLWIAPKLNHYRAGLLRHLGSCLDMMVVLAGEVECNPGQELAASERPLVVERIGCTKAQFPWKLETYAMLRRILKAHRVDAVVMPLEKKFLLLIVVLRLLRHVYDFQLVSYNHPLSWKGGLGIPQRALILQRSLFSLYDKVIFYTEKSRDRIVELGLLNPEKGFFANNTMATKVVDDVFPLPPGKGRPPKLLFVGKLDRRKRLDLLFELFQALSKVLPDVTLTIVGDGLERDQVRAIAASLDHVTWVGEVTDEERTSSYMNEAHILLVPGDSGLAIVHAFAHGKPYVTIGGLSGHGPEIDYLVDGVNGLLLDRDVSSSALRIASLLGDPDAYTEMCQNARASAVRLSAENWCRQIIEAIHA